MLNEKAFCTRKFNESKIFEIFNSYENMYLISSPVAMNETWIPNLKVSAIQSLKIYDIIDFMKILYF